MLLYVQRPYRLLETGEPRMATSTFTQLLSCVCVCVCVCVSDRTAYYTWIAFHSHPAALTVTPPTPAGGSARLVAR